MSTEIQAGPALAQGEITLNQFWGGVDRGTSIQVTQPCAGPALFQHIQLTRQQALCLASDLTNWATGEGWATPAGWDQV